MKMLDLMAKALGMEPNDMRTLFEEGHQGMRMNYYPPCPQPECAIGLNSHSDAGGLTILLQINEMEGLQIRKDGTWIPVKPLPNAFVINIGDIIEVVCLSLYLITRFLKPKQIESRRLSFLLVYTYQCGSTDCFQWDLP